MPRFTVEKVYESATKTTYKVSGGGRGAEPVSVRVNEKNVYACMTCHSIGCVHVSAAIQYVESSSPYRD